MGKLGILKRRNFDFTFRLDAEELPFTQLYSEEFSSFGFTMTQRKRHHLIFVAENSCHQQLCSLLLLCLGSRIILWEVVEHWPFGNKMMNLLRALECNSASTFTKERGEINRVLHTRNTWFLSCILSLPCFSFPGTLGDTHIVNAMCHPMGIPDTLPGFQLASASRAYAWPYFSTGTVKPSGVCLSARGHRSVLLKPQLWSVF